jgi:hypothetical protein
MKHIKLVVATALVLAATPAFAATFVGSLARGRKDPFIWGTGCFYRENNTNVRSA